MPSLFNALRGVRSNSRHRLMISKTSANYFTSRSDKLCAIALLVSALVGTGFGFPRFAARAASHKPIHQAATRGDAARVAQTIRENPSALSAADAKGNTALHLAAFHNRVDAARVLLGAGAQVNATNALAVTPLMLAAQAGSSQVVKLLLKGGADTTIRDARGRTALKWAKKTRHYEIAMRIAFAAARH